MEKDRSTEIRVAAALAVIILLLVAISYAFVFNGNDSGGNTTPLPPFEIEFPKDEGQHHDVTEIWLLVMNLTLDDGSYLIFQVSWTLNNIEESTSSVFLSVTDPENSTGVPYFSEAYDMDEFHFSEGWLNIETTDNKGNHFSIRSVDNRTDTYVLSISASGPVDYAMDARIESKRDPVLYTQNRDGKLMFGSIYLENGTLFGYVQPDFPITADLSVSGEHMSVLGSAAMLHEWGGVWSSIFEISILKEKQQDIFKITYYYPGGDETILDQIYIIHPDEYILYSTFKGNTIGAVINSDGYTDLAGERYATYPTSYVLDPSDPYHHRAYARNWTIQDSYLGLNISIHPYISDQFFTQLSMWAGASYVLSDSHFAGWGYSFNSKNYRSNPKIFRIESQSDNPGTANIKAWVSDTMEMKEVYVEYNYSSSLRSVPMRWDPDCSCWSVDISGIPSGETLHYRVVAVDLADNRDVSDWRVLEL